MAAAGRVAFPEGLRAQYVPLRTVGHGGMGAVFLARDLALEREVAIKVMLTSESASRDRFLREAAVLSGLKHPNILQVYSWGESDHVPYMVMEYLEGRPLGKLPLDVDVLRPMLDVARGLEEVHRAGLVHRDMKPENIVLTDDGVAKLLDFGLVHDPSRTQLTGTGMLVGTIAYLAPDVLAGAECCPASDWYGWGATLYTLLERRNPYEMDDLLAALAGQPLPPVGYQKVALGTGVHTLLEACLSPSPRRRPRGLEEIEGLLEGQALARPDTASEALPARARRPLPRPVLAAGLGALVLVGLLWPSAEVAPPAGPALATALEVDAPEHFVELLGPAGLSQPRRRGETSFGAGPVALPDGRLAITGEGGELVLVTPGHPSAVAGHHLDLGPQRMMDPPFLAPRPGGRVELLGAFAAGPLIPSSVPGGPPEPSEQCRRYTLDLADLGAPAAAPEVLPGSFSVTLMQARTRDGRYLTQHAFRRSHHETDRSQHTAVLLFAEPEGPIVQRLLPLAYPFAPLGFTPFPVGGGYVFGFTASRRTHSMIQLPTVFASLSPGQPQSACLRWRLELPEMPLSFPAPWGDGLLLVRGNRLLLYAADELRGTVDPDAGQVLWTFDEVPLMLSPRPVVQLLPHGGSLDVILSPRVEASRPTCPPLRWLRFEGGDFSRPPREVQASFPDGTYYMGAELHLREPAVYAGGTRAALALGLPHGQGGVFLLDLPRQRVLKYRALVGADPLKIVRVLQGPTVFERPDLGGVFLYMLGTERHLFEWFRPLRPPRETVP